MIASRWCNHFLCYNKGMKRCADCGKKKKLDCFSKDKTKKDKKNLYCKKCVGIRWSDWYRKNKERASERMKKYRQNPEVKKRSWEVEKKRRENTKEEHNAKRRLWYAKNRERILKKDAEKREKNREKINERARLRKKKLRAYYTHLQLQRKARQVRAKGSYTLKEFEDLKKKYNNKCLCCGKKEGEVKITADHVVPLSRGGGNSIKNIQPLCSVCNSRKHVKTVDYR